jgi:SRSO17 transposase
VLPPEADWLVGGPAAAMATPSKGEIALAEIGRSRAAGVRFGIVLANADYGASAELRYGLDAQGLFWAVASSHRL